MALVWNLPFPLFLIYGHTLCFTVFSATVALQQSPPSPKQQLASLANMNFGTWEIEKMVDGKMSCCYGCNRSRAGAALQPAALPAQHSTVCGVRATLPCTALNISWLSNTALSTRKIARYCTVLCSYGWSTGTVLYTGSVHTALSTRMMARHFRDISSLYPLSSRLGTYEDSRPRGDIILCSICNGHFKEIQHDYKPWLLP